MADYMKNGHAKRDAISAVDEYAHHNLRLASDAGAMALRQFLISEAMLSDRLDRLGSEMTEAPETFVNFLAPEQREQAAKAAERAKDPSVLDQIKKKALDSLNSYVRKKIGGIFGGDDADDAPKKKG